MKTQTNMYKYMYLGMLWFLYYGLRNISLLDLCISSPSLEGGAAVQPWRAEGLPIVSSCSCGLQNRHADLVTSVSLQEGEGEGESRLEKLNTHTHTLSFFSYSPQPSVIGPNPSSPTAPPPEL